VKVSAYIPCFNNRETLPEVVASLRRQTLPVDDLSVVDDGSTDGSADLAESLGVTVLRQPKNLGRGAARARAMEAARHEMVLCCDATNILPDTFSAHSARWLEDDRVAAAFGRISQRPGGNAVIRWRGRHLFRIPKPGTPPGAVNRRGWLATYGAMVRRSAVMDAGNYDARLRHTEDAELGQRLLAKGWDVVMDPALEAISIARNSLPQVLERYWRWNAGKDETVSVSSYARAVWFSVRVMMLSDLRDGDVPAALISLYSPHFQFWRSVTRKARTPAQTDRPAAARP
jgi:GT2 family glycosyltransferase